MARMIECGFMITYNRCKFFMVQLVHHVSRTTGLTEVYAILRAEDLVIDNIELYRKCHGLSLSTVKF